VRFFGGGREKFFAESDLASIRGSPLLRSMGSNDFAGDGDGATRAGAFNLTVALPWRHQPLNSGGAELERRIPKRGDVAARGRDVGAAGHLRRRRSELPGCRCRVAGAAPAAALPEGRGRRSAAGGARRAITGIPGLRPRDRRGRSTRRFRLTSSGGGQLGFVRALLPPESGDDDAEDRLGAVDRACARTLNSTLGDKDIAARSTALAGAARDLRDRFNAVDQPAAKRKAESELAVAKRTLKVIVEEMNLWSVSPLLMFDAVHMNVGGTRYGIGAGLRLALADSVDFSIGYMANRQRRPNEPAGAFLMSLQIKDIF